jgi:hypothetical protein
VYAERWSAQRRDVAVCCERSREQPNAWSLLQRVQLSRDRQQDEQAAPTQVSVVLHVCLGTQLSVKARVCWLLQVCWLAWICAGKLCGCTVFAASLQSHSNPRLHMCW